MRKSKFARLFPNGAEVTRELCIKHPDVFSFGCPGARLMPHVGWKAYWDKVLNAKKEYKMRMMIAGGKRQWATRDPEKVKSGHERALARCDDATFQRQVNVNLKGACTIRAV